MNDFPYTNFHDLNLDWILKEFKSLGGRVDEIERILADDTPMQELVALFYAIAFGTDVHGDPLPDTSEFYHNNCEYFKEVAEQKALLAGTSATQAAASVTQCQTIQGACQAILDSIPEDYTQLTRDVNDLKNAFGNVEESVFDTLTTANTTDYTVNQYLSYNYTYNIVAYNNSANYRTIKLFPIDDTATKLYINATSGVNNAETVLVAFYGSDISGEPPVQIDYTTQNSMNTYKNEEIDIPSGAKYFSLTYRVSYDFSCVIASSIKGRISTLEGSSVRFTAQTLTDAQAKQARTNIQAVGYDDYNLVADSVFERLNATNTADYTVNQYISYNYTYQIIAYKNSNNYRTIKLFPVNPHATKMFVSCTSGVNGAETALIAFYSSDLSNDPPQEIAYTIQNGIVTYENQEITVPENARYFSLTYKANTDFSITICSNVDERLSALEEKENAYRVLIIGDSYSKNGQWVSALQDELDVTSLVNLAVVSASLKDKYADRTQYPYTPRPTNSDNSGNKNTFMCQIEKLKRLMTGTDLDEGEEKIYETASEYPNVVIIEGGQNDSQDSDSVVNSYPNQMMKHVTGVYVARTSTDTPSVGDCYIKTPANEVDRTCFAGAYRALVEEILTLFPKAQIFATSRSVLGYWQSNHFPSVTDIAKQQELSCNMCGINFINWQGGAQINTIRNYPKGDGTQSNPYTYAEVYAPGGALGQMDTYDLLHPTTLGGKKYGRVIANAIKAHYLNINDE